ncbi:immunity 49 family protein [Pseudoalteromonas carrageenovora]|uniref:immunity 49 family protein n=1 Tax=Pseudoalteromonas carrageenovora TaxID=227 RepID=UPI0026E2E1F2|nr:immunity 49 family protein [Pseudoalteromonas carrageenovora]MDO6548659.1 immunity 49 family protein [Pseudoalteromonas carrageenovora]MDO6832985.1 immunity 49 family protein [Pseudoalteromonas carrageenovora]
MLNRNYTPNFKNVSLERRLLTSRSRIDRCSINIIKNRDNLLRYAQEYINFSRWLSWEVQTPEIEKESATGLRYASKMYAAFLKLAEQPEQDLTFKIYDLPEVTWNGKGMLESGRAAPSQWIDAYFLAMITRDTESMDSLANFPIETMKQSATQAGPVSYKLVEVFQAYHHHQADYPKLLDECMGMAVKQNDDWAIYIAFGYLETLAALSPATFDVGCDFNEALAKNVQAQERYHIYEAGPDHAPVDSFLPLQLLGMACMWHDMGNEVTVESDSLPRFLINGTYFK